VGTACISDNSAGTITLESLSSNVPTGTFLQLKNVASTNPVRVLSSGTFFVRSYNLIGGTQYMVDNAGTSTTNPLVFTAATSFGLTVDIPDTTSTTSASGVTY